MKTEDIPCVPRSPYLVVLPTYNERDTLPIIVGRILEATSDVDILVIDDSSPDGTASVVQALMAETSRVDLIVRPAKLGLGSAYIRGFVQAISNEYLGVCTMDADNSHDPIVLSAMISAIGECDLVIGSRYASGGCTNQSTSRKINSIVANALARVILALPVRDCTSGYRMYSTALLKRIPLAALQSRGYSMLVELLCEVLDHGGRVKEVPIAFLDRNVGESKIGPHEVFESLRTIARLRRGRFGRVRTKVANVLYNAAAHIHTGIHASEDIRESARQEHL